MVMRVSMMSEMRLETILMSAVMAGQLQKRYALSTLDLSQASRESRCNARGGGQVHGWRCG